MKYTLTNYGDTIVQKDMDLIVAALGPLDPEYVVLFGSYGKGEGAIIDGKPRNDYDILVPPQIADVSRNALEGMCSIPVEVHALPEGGPCTQQLYEIRYASTLLSGTMPDIFAMEPHDIPYSDAVESINKRIVSLIIGKHEIMKEAPDYRKAAEQIIKAIIAVGDATLIKRGEFHPSYFARAILLDGDELGGLYRMAVSVKVVGRPVLDPDQLWALWWEAKGLVRAYCMENSIKPPFYDALLNTTDETTQEDIAGAITAMGGGAWL